MKLLLVDDDYLTLQMFKSYLSEAGFRVDCAQKLGEAKSLLESSRYDVVVTDLHLTGRPGSEGLTLARHVKARWPDTPVLMVTASTGTEVKSEARECGVIEVLQKPVALVQLGKAVARALEAT